MSAFWFKLYRIEVYTRCAHGDGLWNNYSYTTPSSKCNHLPAILITTVSKSPLFELGSNCSLVPLQILLTLFPCVFPFATRIGELLGHCLSLSSLSETALRQTENRDVYKYKTNCIIRDNNTIISIDNTVITTIDNTIIFIIDNTIT